MFHRVLVAVLAIAILHGCDRSSSMERARQIEAQVLTCDVTRRLGCFFDATPVRVRDEGVTLANRPYLFFPTSRPLEFVDANGAEWIAPIGTLTDGASIPRIFVDLIGAPTREEFRGAAAVHDAYCGIGNEEGSAYHSRRWTAVHRMFFDALLVGGTDPKMAKVMFSAVWLGGPRWADPEVEQLGYLSVSKPAPHLRWDHWRAWQDVSREEKRRIFKKVKLFVESRNPTRSELERYMWRQEKQAIAQYRRASQEEDSHKNEQEVVEEPVNEPTDEQTVPVDTSDPVEISESPLSEGEAEEPETPEEPVETPINEDNDEETSEVENEEAEEL